MDVYSGFGYFNQNKEATISICLPAPVNLPADGYEFDFKNISTSSYNGLAIFVKKKTDNGANLSGYSLNYVTHQIPDLSAIVAYSGDIGTAAAFNYNNNMVILIHHEANKNIYNDVAKQFFQNLNTIATTGTVALTANALSAGPAKTGMGTLIKM